ncbi:MAG: hypothetical protein PF487_00375 [Bacteroidales bacterium]|jgi:hypothetical protein|nr:hypothetical protein [Bacteroidales bacterium]
MKFVKYFFLILALTTTISCEKAKDYSIIPEIEFLDFVVSENLTNYDAVKGRLRFSFVDGDGNIGINQPDSINSDSTIYIEESPNLFIKLYDKLNGEFEARDSLYEFRIPYLEGGTYITSIKGSIEVDMLILNKVSDTIKLEFYILDRELNKSNIEISPKILLNN